MKLRGRVGLTGVVVMLVGAGVPVQAEAAPKCFGRRATIVGNARSNTIKGTPRADVIVGLGGIDTIDGRGGADRICGGGNSDFLKGGPGDDRLDAGPGFIEWLDGNGGDDRLRGGPGSSEAVRFKSASGPVIVDLRSGTATGEGNDTISGVDSVVASRFDDVVYMNDEPAGFDFVHALDGDDTVFGLAGDDTLSGGNGDDVLDGGEGFDSLNHLFGHDLYGQDAGPVSVDLVAGTVMGQGSDTVTAVEASTGTPGDDSFVGNDEDNEFTRMYGGNDSAGGGGGNDLIDVGDGDDTADGGDGNDTLSHVDHTVAVTVDLGAATSTGSGADDVTSFENAIGSRYDDSITGTAGPNAIQGTDGADTLYGLDGDDTLVGDWLDFFYPAPDGDEAHGGLGTDACAAETETLCETDPPLAARARGAARLRHAHHHYLP